MLFLLYLISFVSWSVFCIPFEISSLSSVPQVILHTATANSHPSSIQNSNDHYLILRLDSVDMLEVLFFLYLLLAVGFFILFIPLRPSVTRMQTFLKHDTNFFLLQTDKHKSIRSLPSSLLRPFLITEVFIVVEFVVSLVLFISIWCSQGVLFFFCVHFYFLFFTIFLGLVLLFSLGLTGLFSGILFSPPF